MKRILTIRTSKTEDFHPQTPLINQHDGSTSIVQRYLQYFPLTTEIRAGGTTHSVNGGHKASVTRPTADYQQIRALPRYSSSSLGTCFRADKPFDFPKITTLRYYASMTLILRTDFELEGEYRTREKYKCGYSQFYLSWP